MPKSPAQPLPEFQQYQYAFARHLRDPRGSARPAGVPAKRMRVYSELLFNNVSGLVSACFPVARSILGARKWKRLLREFFASHRSRTPYFRQVPEEFLQFMQGREAAPDEPEFLPYLLHYEWVELALDTSDKQADPASYAADGDLWSAIPVLNPVRMLLRYPYAVQRIGRRYRPGPDEQEDTCLLAFRDAGDTVRFNVLNAVSARLLAVLEPGTLTGEQAVAKLVAEIRHPQPDVAMAGGRAMLEDLRDQGAILGTLSAG